MSKEILFEVNGLEVRANSIYKVTNRPDMTAPDGYIKHNTTKVPTIGISNFVPCRFSITDANTNEGIYDTGFYEYSTCYNNQPESEVKERVKSLQKHIVAPYEKMYKKGKLEHSNEEFWDTFNVEVYAEKIFSTNKPKDVLEMYIAVSGHELVPKNKIGDPRFRSADFMIEDQEKVREIRDERAMVMMEAITNFGAKLKSDQKTLMDILKYIGLVGITEKPDNVTLQRVFFEWVKESTTHASQFQKIYSMSEDKKQSAIISLYPIVHALHKKGVIKNIGNEYVFEGEILGADLKTVSKNLNTKELEDIRIKLIELNK